MTAYTIHPPTPAATLYGCDLNPADSMSVASGLPAVGATIAIDPTIMASQSQRILGSSMGTSCISVDIPELIGRYDAGELLLDELVTNRYPLDQINEAIAETAAGGVRRNVIVFDRAGAG